VPFAGDWMLTFIAIAQGGSSIAMCGLGEADEVALLLPQATAVNAAAARAPSARPHGLGKWDMLTPPLEGLVYKGETGSRPSIPGCDAAIRNLGSRLVLEAM